MSFNAIDANKLIDDKILSDKDIKFLTEVRNGVPLSEVEDKPEYKTLKDNGLVQIINLSHPRAEISVPAVIFTEPGITLINVLDERWRNTPEASTPDQKTPEDVNVKKVREAEAVTDGPDNRAKTLAETGDKKANAQKK